jgi:type III secretory pathway component EscR
MTSRDCAHLRTLCSRRCKRYFTSVQDQEWRHTPRSSSQQAPLFLLIPDAAVSSAYDATLCAYDSYLDLAFISVERS